MNIPFYSFWNYRHHSDVAHAYQIAKRNGISPDRIITMLYNDVPTASQNPFKGQLYNKPTPAGTPGVDVYNGITIDYTGSQVTANNFLAVISGNVTALKGVNDKNSKVVKSTAKDNIFIYYSDHGSVGSIAMPVGPALSVSALQNTLKSMAANKRFNKLVFYLEACESGSMFEGWLPNNLRIYATTAANAHESSWGWYCSPDDKVNGKAVGSCLGDEYSIQFLESVDRNGGLDQTLQQNYETVRAKTTKSHVMQYGDLSFASDKLSEFLSEGKSRVGCDTPTGIAEELAALPAPGVPGAAVDSRDIKLHFHFNAYTDKSASDADRAVAGKALIEEIQHRLVEDAKYQMIADRVIGRANAQVLAIHTAPTAKPAASCGRCCDVALEMVHAKCGGFSDYSLKYGRTLTNLCLLNDNMTEEVSQAISEVCSKNIQI